MPDRAKTDRYAIPAINITSSQTLSVILQGFTEVESDGIIQASNGGAAYWSGSSYADRIKGPLAVSVYAYLIADLYPITFALYTDHRPRKLVDAWLRLLLEVEIEQAKHGGSTVFQSHVWDGFAETFGGNIKLAAELLAMSKKANTTLEIEIGAVGGEEDDIEGEENTNLYTTADDAWTTVETLDLGENGRCATALTSGSVHSTCEPGHVELHPELLGEIQVDVAKRLGDRLATKAGDKKTPFDLAMYGGSGSIAEEITTAVCNGIIKASADTDTQYVFTHSVADHIFKSCDGVLKTDGEVGSKKTYDPHAWGKAVGKDTAARTVEACERLGPVDPTHKWVPTPYGVEQRLITARSPGALVVPGLRPVRAGSGEVGGETPDGELIDRSHSCKGG